MLDLRRRSQKTKGPDVRAYVHDLEQWLIETLGLFGIRGERREGRVGIWVRRGSSASDAREDKIAALGDFEVEAWAVPDRIGIWTRDVDGSEAKIGAIGVRVRKWVTMHGFAVNLDPDLSHFSGIVPCGIAEYGVTSLARLGLAVGPEEWDGALRARAGDFLASLEMPE
jgi:lipoate-protein ligase B